MNGSRTCIKDGSIGEQYNPYEVMKTPESGYMNDCSSRRQRRCAMGDLSGKLGTLILEPNSTNPHKTYSFYDENLHLAGPFTSEFKWLLLSHASTCIGSMYA